MTESELQGANTAKAFMGFCFLAIAGSAALLAVCGTIKLIQMMFL